MKTYLYSTVAVLAFATSAFADGLTELGLDDPEVMAPPSVSGDWTGPYVGLSYGRTTATTETYREWLENNNDGYDYHEAACTRGTTSDNHQNNKCRLNDELFKSLNFGAVSAPWEVAPYKLNDGALTDAIAKYDAGYKGLWLGDDKDGVYTWRLGEYVPDQSGVDALNASGDQDAVLSVKHQFKEDTFTKMSETVTSVTEMDDLGAFVGYRHDFGRVVGGVELGVNGNITSLEAQAGFDLGNVLVYGFGGVARFDDTDGTVFGAGTDLKINKNLVVGVKHTIGEFDNTDTESTMVRAAIKF